MLIVCSLVLFIPELLRMRIKFEFFNKNGILFLFYFNCAKADAPIKGPKHVFNIGTYRPVKMCMCSGFLLTGCCLDDKQSPFIYKYNLSQKSSVYVKHI